MEFKLNRGGMPTLPPNAPLILLVPGIGFVAFGVLLLYNEKLLVYIVAGVFIVLGVLLTLAGMRAKKMLG